MDLWWCCQWAIAKWLSATLPQRICHPLNLAMTAQTSIEQRNTLVLQYMPMVRATARSVANWASRSVDIQDLVSEGALALIKAIDRLPASDRWAVGFLTRLSVKGAMIRAVQYSPVVRHQVG
jgi:DNA-directed RNA polymerase specialized sigma subunit